MISFLIGLACFALAFWVTVDTKKTEFSGFYDESALLLLITGPIAVVLVSRGIFATLKGFKTVIGILFSSPRSQSKRVIKDLSELHAAVRSEGLGSLMSFKDRVKNQFLREGIQMVLGGFSADEIRQHLSVKIQMNQSLYQNTGDLFETLGKNCPAMGLIGTVIGLILMLSHLSDPTNIGTGMAVALLATLYGLILGTVIYTPLCDKVRHYGEKMYEIELMALNGLILIKDKKSEGHLENIFSTYSRHGKKSSS